MATPWIVVSDFDGTLTVKDIGNELCLEAFPDKFKKIHATYKRGELDLRSMQKLLWTHFPYNAQKFRERALALASLRPGVNSFFEKCVDQKIPVFVASCGLKPYITPVLDSLLSPKAATAIKDLRCNLAEFDHEKISVFTAPDSDSASPYPLDKGAWAKELALEYGGSTKILGIGNGTSDQSMIGSVNLLAATEGLEEHCKKNELPYIPFEDFRDLLSLVIFS